MRRIIYATLLAATLGLTSLAGFGQSLGEGYGAYFRGDYQTALEHFRPSAEQGDAIAQHYLGMMYDNGEGVVRDRQEAARWYRRSAAQGYAIAQYDLGHMYENGEGVTQNSQEAVRLYRLSADQGYPPAQYNLGLLYAHGDGVPQNYVTAVEWYKRAALQGHDGAFTNLGFMYIQDRGVSLNPVLSHTFSTISAALGNEDGRYNRDLGLEHLNREQINEAQRLASEWRVGTPLPTSRDVTTWP